ncbi:MAG: TetR/AcrR family transcriptional regulator [Micromonosporaceae bacterium]
MSSEAAPAPPWQRPSKAPRPALSQDGIVEVAVRLLDQEGLDAISMRRVAQALGTGVASLYVHVANKEQLLQLVLDRIYGELTVPPPDPAHWQKQVKDFARDLRALLHRHRDIARITFGPMPVGPHFVVVMEGFLAILDAGGVRGHVASAAGDIISLYAQAYALEESSSYQTADSGPPRRDAAQIRDYLTSLPSDRFPHVLGLAALMQDGNADDRFELGLDVLIRGIEAAR